MRRNLPVKQRSGGIEMLRLHQRTIATTGETHDTYAETQEMTTVRMIRRLLVKKTVVLLP